MSGETFGRIDFLRFFVELIYDIGKEAAAGGKNAVGHISGEFSVRTGEVFGKFIGKS